MKQRIEGIIREGNDWPKYLEECFLKETLRKKEENRKVLVTNKPFDLPLISTTGIDVATVNTTEYNRNRIVVSICNRLAEKYDSIFIMPGLDEHYSTYTDTFISLICRRNSVEVYCLWKQKGVE